MLSQCVHITDVGVEVRPLSSGSVILFYSDLFVVYLCVLYCFSHFCGLFFIDS